ncbi:MAG TPA: mechanosensitive ion channel family protein [Caulobacteraceae bacterium]|nr:mechanosensitive ion channel family protein [Caulobacteraceae bacterium]
MTTSAAPVPPPPISDQVRTLVVGGPSAWVPVLAAVGHALLNLAIGIGMLLVTLWVADWAAKLTRDAMGRLRGQSADHKPDLVLQTFMASVARYAVVIIGMIAVLQQIGVQTTSVLAVLGAASLAIGLALQGGLSNVAAGVMILLLRPYRIGDQVTIAGVQGRVQGMDLFVTRVTDFDGVVVFIPNAKAIGDIIKNDSLPAAHRVVVEVPLPYAADLSQALETMLETAKADARVLPSPAPWAKVTGLGDTVTVTLRAWTRPELQADVRCDLIKQLKDRLRATA